MKFNVIKQSGTDLVSARELYSELGIVKDFSTWFKMQCERAFLNAETDFTTLKGESTGGRPSTDYLLTIESAKRISIVSHTKESKKIIDYLLDLDKKRENFELLSVKEAAYAYKVINCLKYIENQKEAYTEHQKHFLVQNADLQNENYIYSEFAKYRAKLVGWTKEQTNKAIEKYLIENPTYSKKLHKSNMQIQISVLDIGEAIRISVLDVLYSKDTESNLAVRFSEMCKKLANEMQVQPEKENTTNIFQEKQNIDNVKTISLK